MIKFDYAPPIAGVRKGIVRNVLVNPDGSLSATPFDMPRLGFWYFDGQVYYQLEVSNDQLQG